MTPSREEPEISTDEPPVVKTRLSLVVMLSMGLGVLLSIGSVGGYVLLQQRNALQLEVLTVKAALAEKSRLLDEINGQIDALSKQIGLLKEYSIARSTTPAEADVPVPVPIDAAKPPEGKAVAEQPPLLVKPKKPKPDAQNCELVGKSPAEQVATLQRCVGLIEPGKEKSGSQASPSSAKP